MLVKAGDWICIPGDKVPSVQKQMDNNEPITDVFTIKKATMEKSYQLNQANTKFVPDDLSRK